VAVFPLMTCSCTTPFASKISLFIFDMRMALERCRVGSCDDPRLLIGQRGQLTYAPPLQVIQQEGQAPARPPPHDSPGGFA